jgi:hypothetical protein
MVRFVMPGLVPGIHAFAASKEDVDGRDEPGHDEWCEVYAHARTVAGWMEKPK